MIRLKECRLNKNLKQSDVARFLNIATNSYSQWENGKREPDYESLSKLADFFGVSVDYLLGRSDEPSPAGLENVPGIFPIKKKKIPVLGNVACGEPTFADEQRDAWIMASDDIEADFCLVAHGDSMTGAHIEDGDIVFIKQMEVVPNGYIAVVLIDDETTLKYVDYRMETFTLILSPANPAYRMQVYQGEELNRIRILGMAVALYKNLARRR